jgi:polyhydroxybutyrate depolymerase
VTPERVQVRVGGRDRPVLVGGPQTPVAGGSPLLLVLHGSGGNAAVALEMSGVLDLAPAAGYVVAAPQGSTPLDTGDGHPAGGWAWNVPSVPLLDGTPPTGPDDVEFLLDLVRTLGPRVDAQVGASYVVGFSGGARMACAMAAWAPEHVAGLGVVAGLRAGRAAAPGFRAPDTEELAAGPPVPVIAFHGTDDPVNPLAGDGLPRWGYSVEHAARAWATRNGLPTTPETSRTTPHVVRHRYGAGRPGEVQLHVVEGGGHTWPSGTATNPLLGTSTDEISATALMLAFFAATAQPRPADTAGAPGPRPGPDGRARR